MRHRKAGIKLNRTTSHRQAMFRNMVTSLFKHERIRTTDVKAKELRRWADKIITLAKRGDLHARRQALAIVREKDIVHKLFEEADKRFGKINGGYTRVTKIGRRPGDAALISIIELVSIDESKRKKKKKAKAPTKKEAPAETPVAEKEAVDQAAPDSDAVAAAEQETEEAIDTQAAEAEASEQTADEPEEKAGIETTAVEAQEEETAAADSEGGVEEPSEKVDKKED